MRRSRAHSEAMLVGLASFGNVNGIPRGPTGDRGPERRLWRAAAAPGPRGTADGDTGSGVRRQEGPVPARTNRGPGSAGSPDARGHRALLLPRRAQQAHHPPGLEPQDWGRAMLTAHAPAPGSSRAWPCPTAGSDCASGVGAMATLRSLAVRKRSAGADWQAGQPSGRRRPGNFRTGYHAGLGSVSEYPASTAPQAVGASRPPGALRLAALATPTKPDGVSGYMEPATLRSAKEEGHDQ